ncbi:MAG: V-type ATP synthase subunit E family protein [Thaumarchaeota archaeon]|nr:V-type ATP synthase subunit E family protein [Nitrososphaerota archaeon]
MSNIKKGIENVVGKAIESSSKENRADLKAKFEDSLKVLQESEAITERDVKKIQVETTRQVDALKRKVSGAAGLTVKNATLALIEEYVSKAFDGATQKLQQDFVRSRRYDRFLSYVIEEGAEKVAKNNLILSANSKDLEKARMIVKDVEKKLGIKIKVNKQMINCIGGIRIGDSEQTMLYDNTIEMRLSRADASLRKEVANIYLRGEEKIGS